MPAVAPATIGATRKIACLSIALALLLAWWLAATPPHPGHVFGRYTIHRFAALSVLSYAALSALYCLALPRAGTALRAAQCALAGFVVFLLIGCLELLVAARVADFRKLFAPPDSVLFTRVKPWQNPSNLLDPELIHIHRPNQRLVGHTSGDLVPVLGIATERKHAIDVRYDSRGFRNETDITTAPLVILGDSFVEAGLVPAEELLSSRLARQLGADVANLGQSGYSPQQELLVLKRFGLPLRPKVVFWLFFEGNDLLDVARYERLMESWASGPPAVPFLDRSFSKNILLALARLTEPRLRVDSENARRRRGHFTLARDDAERNMYFVYTAAPLAEEELDSLRKAQDILRDASRRCDEAGARLVLVFVPTKFRVYGAHCRFEPDALPREWHDNDLPQRLETWARSEQIPYLDLTGPLRRKAAEGELVFFTDDGHWNGLGNHVATDAIVRFMQDNRLMPQADRPVAATSPGTRTTR
jgi:hypothetical protein